MPVTVLAAHLRLKSLLASKTSVAYAPSECMGRRCTLLLRYFAQISHLVDLLGFPSRNRNYRAADLSFLSRCNRFGLGSRQRPPNSLHLAIYGAFAPGWLGKFAYHGLTVGLMSAKHLVLSHRTLWISGKNKKRPEEAAFVI